MLQLTNISKTFGKVQALTQVSLQVRLGEVVGLVGENGAGKSTLMKVLNGNYQPDAGSIEIHGERCVLRGPHDAARHGIGMVFQEQSLVPNITVAENIFLGREDCSPLGWLHRSRMMQRAERLIEEHHFPLQAGWRVGKLSPAGKQMVEICRALQQGSSLLIFDEPTSSLSESETREVFKIVGTLRERGMGVIYITHRLEELRSVGDRVTVLRDGVTVHSGPLAELTIDQLIHHMVGREISAIYSREPGQRGAELLRVTRLNRAPLLKDISFSLYAGEITGMAGRRAARDTAAGVQSQHLLFRSHRAQPRRRAPEG